MGTAAATELGVSHPTARKRNGWDSKAAARTNAYRQRRRAGRIIVGVEVGVEDLEVLCEAKVLDARHNFHSRRTIATALQELLKVLRHA